MEVSKAIINILVVIFITIKCYSQTQDSTEIHIYRIRVSEETIKTFTEYYLIFYNTNYYYGNGVDYQYFFCLSDSMKINSINNALNKNLNKKFNKAHTKTSYSYSNHTHINVDFIAVIASFSILQCDFENYSLRNSPFKEVVISDEALILKNVIGKNFVITDPPVSEIVKILKCF
jgi:hypothetical protein